MKKEKLNDLKASLDKQISDKIKGKKDQENLKIQEREIITKIEKEYKENIKQNSINKKLETFNIKKNLDNQIINKKPYEFMSENEKKFNNSILKISTDQ